MSSLMLRDSLTVFSPACGGLATLNSWISGALVSLLSKDSLKKRLTAAIRAWAGEKRTGRLGAVLGSNICPR